MIDLIGPVLLTGLALAFAVALQRVRLPNTPAASSKPQKTPVLGGAAPETHAWQRYHVRYYSMTLLFIAFEMEMMFMYPWAVVYVEEGMMALMEMGMFLAILSIGILYGWREGVFRWQ
ncbi:NADH-quinone oxidoreductase subunit A [Fodinicurvata halophila]|uniref:NADH-quinone oxidoreductase subunit n=1 Tax=Fodinicurvata halophila TaxID=1419723 RepID=A0ABV8UI94_9PROT